MTRIRNGSGRISRVTRRGDEMKACVALGLLLFASIARPQEAPKKYPWQASDTNCNKSLTFCWYGADIVSDPEVTAYGQRWLTTDKDERPFEWVTEVRCVKALRICVLARNQKLAFGGGTQTDI